ncbi:MAG: hypothetical protein EBZ47_08350, partial [Chlamydiae bacterium]|nr:hypothetical protein [Chlamydiota bacterium]
ALADEPENETIEVSVGNLNIPSQILVKFPEVPDIRVIHDIPVMIKIETPEISDIKILAPSNMPTEIKMVSDIPSRISIDLVSTNLPKSVEVDFRNLPRAIPIIVPDTLPDIKIDASAIPDKIQVVGIPSTIELVGAPSEIKLVLPEKPEIELVYKGAPIDVKINLDIGRITGEGENAQCVAIVPCPGK